MKASTSHGELTAHPIPVNDLLLDADNPRLLDAGIGPNATQEQILNTLWTMMAVDEVALSIAENGFYQHEPLYATKHGDKYHVIEGNRRLAAVMLLRNDRLRTAVKVLNLPSLSASEKRKLDELPVIVCKREQIW